MKNTSYHVVTLEVPLTEAEVIQAQLYARGCLGLEEEAGAEGLAKIRAYFDDEGPLSAFLERLKGDMPSVSSVTGTTIDLHSIVKAIPTFEPIEWANGVWVFPPADMETKTHPEVDRKLIIRPGMGFGTGRHETTRLTAELMTEAKSDVTRFLDVGSGSGILAIYADRELKFPHVDAVEIDENARENAEENFVLNGSKSIQLTASINDVKGPYDLIAANIILSTLKFLKPDFLKLLKPQGHLVLSGVLVNEEGELIEAFEKDFQLLKMLKDKEWTASLWRART